MIYLLKCEVVFQQSAGAFFEVGCEITIMIMTLGYLTYLVLGNFPYFPTQF